MTAAYGCCGQALTRFTGHPCTGPGRLRERRRSVGKEGYARPPHPYTLHMHPPGGPQMPAPAPVPDGSDQKTRSTVLTAVRMFFLILTLAVPLLTAIRFRSGEGAASRGEAVFLENWWWLPLVIGVVFAASFLAIDLLIPRKKISTLAGILLGLIGGLLATVALSFIVDLVAESWDLNTYIPTLIFVVKILLGIAMCYLGISTVLQTQDDFRLVIPYVEFAKQMRGVRPHVLDTSALIDSRIVDVAETGISQAPIIIPQFVVAELQRLADSADRLKRARGRRGLEVVARLQRSALLDVSIDESPMPSKAVDHMLVDLARQLPAIIVTTDVGLAQVASIHGVVTLNLNDLANALRPNVVPGEHLSVQLIRRGEQRTQAVGYLADGTMVVAEDGQEHIGEQVELTVTSMLQTSAGRMIFGRIGPEPRSEDGSRAEREPAPAPPAETDGPDAASGNAHAQPAAEEAASGDAPPTARAEPPRGPFPPKGPARANRARNPRR